MEGSGKRPPGYWLIASDPEFADKDGGDLRLNAGSPCLDRGDNYVDWDPLQIGFQPIPPTDIEGNWRIVDGNGDGVPQVDLGAYEYQGK